MSILAVVTLLIVVIATAQAGIPGKPYYNLLTYENDDYEEAFKSLDLNNDNTIKIDDLKSFYFHKDSEFAINKFIQMLDTSKSPGSIDKEEFKSFMNRDHVKENVHEVSYSPTAEVRQRFYADEILSYVYLVIDKHAIDNLFTSIESSADGKLDFNEILEMEVKLMNGDTQYELSDWEAKLVLAEIGAGSDTISKEDFQYYLQDGKLGFFFRECRKSLTATGAQYDNACLIRNLVRYITRHLTEYMMTRVFHALDAKDNDERVSYDDIQEVFGCNQKNAFDFISFINGRTDKKMTYGEFRLAMISQTFKSFLEQECLSKGRKYTSIEDRTFCLKWKLWSLISKRFEPKYIGVPGLHLIFLFEDLDTTDDGIIEQEEDLENGKSWVTGLATKFMDEVGSTENKAKVDLQDFFYYVYQPQVMCAVGECQIKNKNNEKLNCYIHEMKDLITNVLPKNEVDGFYRFYKHNVIYDGALLKTNVYEPAIENYLTELGQGDHYVVPIEFKYFVKQQELSQLFVEDQHATPRKHLSSSMLHDKLLYYLAHYMTEYDTLSLFRKLDVNNDMVLDARDVRRVEEIDDDLIERMALYGNKEQVSFQEFWIFLNSKAPGSNEPRKHQLEKECGQIHQELQLTCFKGKINSIQ